MLKKEEELNRRIEEGKRKAEIAQKKKQEDEEKYRREEERIKEEQRQKQELEKQRRKSRIDPSQVTQAKDDMKDDIILNTVKRKESSTTKPQPLIQQSQQATPPDGSYSLQDNLPYIKPRQDTNKPSNKSVDTVDNGDTSKLSQSRKTSTAIPPTVTRKQDLPNDDAALAENLRKLQQDEEERQRDTLLTQREIERKKKEMEEYEASA